MTNQLECAKRHTTVARKLTFRCLCVGVERRQRGTGVAQWHHAAAADEGGGAEGFGVGDALVGRIGGVEQSEALFVLGSGERAGVDDDTAICYPA